MPARLRPTAPIAPDAILVGDPGRALMLAQELLEQPKMSNHARGLWGYGGETAGGRALTIQSTGMGGPSASVVLHDLVELGVRRAVRVGTCTTLGGLELGELMVVTEAEQSRGSFVAQETTKEPRDSVLPDQALTEALVAQFGDEVRRGSVVSLDLLHRHHREPQLTGDAADMQTAVLLQRGKEMGVAVAAVLITTEGPDQESLGDEKLEEAARRAGRAAAAALSP